MSRLDPVQVLLKYAENIKQIAGNREPFESYMTYTSWSPNLWELWDIHKQHGHNYIIPKYLRAIGHIPQGPQTFENYGVYILHIPETLEVWATH